MHFTQSVTGDRVLPSSRKGNQRLRRCLGHRLAQLRAPSIPTLLAMINYMLLVSRQGTTSVEVWKGLLLMHARREGPTCEMVPDDVSEGQGEDREGRYPAGACASDAHV